MNGATKARRVRLLDSLGAAVCEGWLAMGLLAGGILGWLWAVAR